MREIPRVAGLSSEPVVGFVGHQEFGRIGIAEKDCACGFKTRNERSVLGGNIVFAEERAGGAGPSGDVNATLERERYAVKRSERLAAREGRFRGAGLAASAFGVQMHEGIQFWLAGGDALEVSFDQLRRRNAL